MLCLPLRSRTVLLLSHLNVCSLTRNNRIGSCGSLSVVKQRELRFSIHGAAHNYTAHSKMADEERSSTTSSFSNSTSPRRQSTYIIPERPVLFNSQYESFLESSVDQLQSDFESGARGLADNALSSLSTLIDLAATTAADRGDLFKMVKGAAKQLSFARPSMSAAITNCLLHALQQIQGIWDKETKAGSKTPTDLARIAQEAIGAILKERKALSVQLGKQFAFWMKQYSLKPCAGDEKHYVHILTLSNSSSIITALLSTLSRNSNTTLTVTILESRPRFEGASMAAQILSSVSEPDKDRLSIRIAPDCAVATVAADANVVLLGADRIASNGDVSNKIGSLAAAICARSLNPSVQVVVVSDSDKIVAAGSEHSPVERHDAKEMTEAWEHLRVAPSLRKEVDVFGEWFEWVEGKWIDVYVTERGIWGRRGVEIAAARVKEIEEKMFGGS
ncbi:nagb/rpia/CoA transferase-like protein [Lindgomyces ingoldianus]|uniref:Nagb/rpia/CoA transferase-like protein n=1 Tax=Lindgomyces ingoldianus TaxID=673940 RepID=A0ACB6QPT1_9PLEO|nr:nagb/rpia/CoA transferase-like protein [Lindgomyces ingoldianus]KAF2468578.1 nagb/rpia/CoA transferase-like protein [Lindgomyces ingoldianus]